MTLQIVEMPLEFRWCKIYSINSIAVVAAVVVDCDVAGVGVGVGGCWCCFCLFVVGAAFVGGNDITVVDAVVGDGVVEALVLLLVLLLLLLVMFLLMLVMVL